MVIRLYLMRHGEAELGVEDFKRQLTAFGCRQAVEQAKALLQAGQLPAAVRASPLVRAQQTAALVVEELQGGLVVETDEYLAGGGEPRIVMEHLEKVLTADDSVMLVTHQPLVSRLIYYLTGEEVGMATAAVAVVDLEVMAESCGELQCVY